MAGRISLGSTVSEEFSRVVMAGLVPAIHAQTVRTQMTGTGPAMTVETRSGRRLLLSPARIPMGNPAMTAQGSGILHVHA